MTGRHPARADASPVPVLETLVSVRDLDEARVAAQAGVAYIDLKDPALGALGAWPLPQLRQAVQALRGPASGQGFAGRISATIGDWPFEAALAPAPQPAVLQAVLGRVEAVAACGVDDVKVGLPAQACAAQQGPDAVAQVLEALAGLRLPRARVVPVLLVDEGLAPQRVAQALGLGLRVLMVDTAHKAGGSLLQRLPLAVLQGFLQQVRAAGGLPGLAGALRLQDVPALRALAPGFAGFRSAVCAGPRAGALCPQRLAALLAAARVQA